MTLTGYVSTDYGNGPTVDVAVNAASNGNNTLVAAVSGKRIVVLLGDLVASGAVTATMQTSGGTVLDGPLALAANGGKIYPQTERGHFATGAGEGLVLNLSGATQVGGHMKYALV